MQIEATSLLHITEGAMAMVLICAKSAQRFIVLTAAASAAAETASKEGII